MNATKPGRTEITDVPFWSHKPEDLLAELASGPQGLTGAEAERRVAEQRPNRLHARESESAYILLLAQFKNPITVLMIVAAVISIFLGEHSEGVLILIILVMSGLLGFWQERRAAHTVQSPLGMLKVNALAILLGYGLTSELAKRPIYRRYRP
ncbi:MAG: cation-transporting P-type ATPase [Fibrobacteria bacterium]